MKCEVCKNKKAEMDFNMPITHGLIFRADTCIDCGLQLHDFPHKIIKIMEFRIKELGLKKPLPLEKMREVAFTKTADIKEVKK